MTGIPDAAMEKLIPILDRHIQTLPSDQAATIEKALHTPGALQITVMSDGTQTAVHVTALLDDGPHLLMRVAPETIGLEP